MGRVPGSVRASTGLIKKGPWTVDEDLKLKEYIDQHGACNWRTLPQNAGLQRCGKSCRLRWTNYLRPDIKRGRFSFEEEEAIIQLHSVLGNKWSSIAARLPGRTDNEIKNYWNTHIRKRLLRMGLNPVTHALRLNHLLDSSSQLNDLSNLLLVLTQQQKMANPPPLDIVTTLLSMNYQEQSINQSMQVPRDSNCPTQARSFQSPTSSYLQPKNNTNGGCSEIMFPALVEDMAAGTSSFGSFNNNSNNKNLSFDYSTAPSSYTSSPLDLSYDSIGLSAEDEIDSFLNFETPEGFDISELLY